MQLYILVALFVFIIPFSQAFSQTVDTPPSLIASFVHEQPFLYVDSEGNTVAVGEIINNNKITPVRDVKIKVEFFNEYSTEPHVIYGTTILDVIPTGGKTPYSISSQDADFSITGASVSIVGFEPAAPKLKEQTVYFSSVTSEPNFKFSGILNNGDAPSTNTKVHVAFYDQFDPPRLLKISTINLGDVDANTNVPIKLEEKINPLARTFALFAESDVFYSDYRYVKIPDPQSLTKLVSITALGIQDKDGNSISKIKLGTTASITSEIDIIFFSPDLEETPYTFYTQVKEFGENPTIEFIGAYSGRLAGVQSDTPVINWTPEKKGVFFIETFVWDREHVPLAVRGPISIVIVS